MITEEVINNIKSHSNKDYVKWLSPLLQVTEGSYGENDKLYGVKVPVLRKIAKQYYDMELSDVETLLHDDYHEVRLTALFILIHQYKNNRHIQEKILKLYLKNADYINNWDLVDLSAPNILGDYIYNHQTRLNILYNLSNSKHLWKERIAIVSTQYLIKNGFYEPTIKLSEKYLTHPHHLIHKAVGWMLRELGKKDLQELYSFLDKFAQYMPRVMLRYSIERLPKEDREYYLSKRNK